MKELVVVLTLLPPAVFAADVNIDVTPANMENHGLEIGCQVTEQIAKEGDKPARVTGYTYQFTVRSKKVDLKDCQVFLRVTDGKDSYLHASLQRNPHALKAGFILCGVTLSRDYLDSASVIIHDYSAPGSSSSYGLKIKDWVSSEVQKDPRLRFLEIAEFKRENALIRLGQTKAEVRNQIERTPVATAFGKYSFLKPEKSMFSEDQWVLVYTKEHAGLGRVDTLRLTFNRGKVAKLEHQVQFMP